MTFSGPLEDCDANEAELSALLFALRWYAQNDLGPLIAEGDSSNTIAWAGNKACGPWLLAFKIDEIRDQLFDLCSIILLDRAESSKKRSAEPAARPPLHEKKDKLVTPSGQKTGVEASNPKIWWPILLQIL
ncbi:uncharacterized protein LOC143863571 isoform X2 [Tasmannia lanceolata]|uniref:uncharacterized protein LOC143863571 isoform X2 n=1 Tax=Tasmannia lanceolata TaxID=3420 RepID=UPI004062D544